MEKQLEDLRGRQVICVADGSVIGTVSDLQVDVASGQLTGLVIYGRPRLMGLLGHEADWVIPWKDIAVIGAQTVLVNTPPPVEIREKRRTLFG